MGFDFHLHQRHQ